MVCWSDGIKWGFLSALLFLQGIMVMWFAMILRVAISVLRGAQAEDVRSDDESSGQLDDADEDQKVVEKLAEADGEGVPYEEEVGVDQINLKGRTSNASRYKKAKGAGSASGVSIPGHSDRKELLGRIGCDKGT
jgi:acyl-CoA-dependent ceramide synthase